MRAAVAAINFEDDNLIATTTVRQQQQQQHTSRHNCQKKKNKNNCNSSSECKREKHPQQQQQQQKVLTRPSSSTRTRTQRRTRWASSANSNTNDIPTFATNTTTTTTTAITMQNAFLKSLTAVAALATTGTTVAAAAAAATFMHANLNSTSTSSSSTNNSSSNGQDIPYNFNANNIDYQQHYNSQNNNNNSIINSSTLGIQPSPATTDPAGLVFVATTAVTGNASNTFAYQVTDTSASNHSSLFIESAEATTAATATAASTLTLTTTASTTSAATASATSTYNATFTTAQTHDELVEWSHFYDLILSWKGISLIAVFCIFIIITIIGNTLVILAVITTRRLKTVTNCFVMSLAVADLLVGIFVMPPAVAVHLIGSWQLGWVLCDIWISLDVLLCTASILSLCAISVDRYLAVTRPLSYSRKRRSKRLALVMILIVWLLALAITCPPMLGWYEPGRRDLKECRYNQNEGYVIFSAMGSFFIPMMVMIYVYARISCVIASRHDNMTDISVHNKKFKRYTASDVDNDIDHYLSEQELNLSQKKQLAARTFSNQTIAKELHEILRDDDAADDEADDAIVHIETLPRAAANVKAAHTSKNNHKNGCYELTRPASLRRTPIIVTTLATASTTPVHSPHKAATTTTAGKTTTTTNSNESCLRYHAGVYTNPQHQQYIRVHSFRQHHLSAPAATNAGSMLAPLQDTALAAAGKQQLGRVHQHHHHHNSKSLSNRITSLKKENKTTQTLSIVVGGFIACWLPFFIYYLITPFLPKSQQNETLAKGLTWLGWFNSAINPFIYAFYSVDFRAAFWRLTCKRFFNVTPTKQQFQTNTMSIRR